MINKNIHILFFILVSQLSFSQIDTISLNSLNLNGKIKSISNRTYLARDSIGVIKNGKYLNKESELKIDEIQYNKTNFIFKFNEKGKQILKGFYNEDGKLFNITEYKYLYNQIIESSQTYEFSDFTSINKGLYKYDTNNNLVSITFYRNGEFDEKELLEYNELGDLIEYKIIDDSGNITKKITKKYLNHLLVYEKDVNKSRTIEKIFRYNNSGGKTYSMDNYQIRDDNESHLSEFNIEYKNNLRSKEYMYRNGKLNYTVHYEYLNENVSKILIKNSDDNSISSEEVILYYPNSNKIIEKIKKDKESTLKQSLDKNGNIMELQITRISSDSEVYSYEYFYDNIGNWTKIIEFKNTIPLKIRERTITYY